MWGASCLASDTNVAPFHVEVRAVHDEIEIGPHGVAHSQQFGGM